MAGNSSVFYLRQEVNDSNIKQWQNWSVNINYVVDQFNDVIQNLNDRLDMANITIEALQIKLNKAIQDIESLNYINLQYDFVEINSAKDITYTKPCGVFSANPIGHNTINIFATKTIDGLYINNKPVYAHHIGDYNEPFTQIAGSDQGSIITIKSNNMTKIGSDIELYFAFDSSLKDNSIGSNFDPNNDNDIARLKIKPIYSQVISKQLITLDKSALAKTLTKTTIMSTDAISVNKSSTPIGRYSTTKTIAQIAKDKNKLY